MALEKLKNRIHPYDDANRISKFLFYWIWKYFAHPATQFLSDSPCIKNEQSSDLELKANRFSSAKQVKLQCDTLDFRLRLFSPHITKMVLLFVPLAVVECICKPAIAICLRHFLKSLQHPDSNSRYIFSAGIVIFSFIVTFVTQPVNFEFQKISSKCRILCSKLIYGKSLKLSTRSLEQTNLGKITNMLANDACRFDQSLKFMPYLVISPIQYGIFFYLLWLDFGMMVLPGFGLIFLLIPLQYFNGKCTSKLRIKMCECTDKRSKLMSEVVRTISVIKMYAWELPMIKSINFLKRQEIRFLKKRFFLRGLYSTMYSSMSKLVPFTVLLWYMQSSEKFNTEKVFFMVACFNTVIQSMTYTFPLAISLTGELLISLSRIESFLQLEEKQSENLTYEKQENFVCFNNVTSSWNNVDMHLSNIDLQIKDKMLVYVVGPVGAGKSSLLKSIMGELKPLNGSVNVSGVISYSSQKPWIIAGTIRDNILLGRQMDLELYNNVISASQLFKDLQILPREDETYVGENGSSLSGGQCSRISLARCIYQQADIYLLDDPFSALDANVYSDVFNTCVMGFLKDKIRILVTHDLTFINEADYIVVMDENKIVRQGTPLEIVSITKEYLLTKDGDARQHPSIIKPAEEKDFGQLVLEEGHENVQNETEAHETFMLRGSLLSILRYMKVGSSKILLAVLLVNFVITQICVCGAEYWLSYTSNEEAKPYADKKNTDQLLMIYGLLVSAVIFGNITQSVSFFSYCANVAYNIHSGMLSGIFYSPMGFFQQTSFGSILNRFTKDLVSIDETLPSNMFDMCVICLQMTVSISLIVVADYYMAIPAAILVVCLYLMRQKYIRFAKDLRRLEVLVFSSLPCYLYQLVHGIYHFDSLTAKSPIFSHVFTSMSGLVTLRSAKAENTFMNQFDALQDTHSSVWFLLIAAARGFSMWIEIVCNIFLLVLVTIILLAYDTRSGTIGLAMTSALSLSNWMQQALRQSTEVENLMIPLERLLAYSKLKSEDICRKSQDKNPPANWPQTGATLFHNVSLSYGTKEVLKHLTFDIKSNEKIGIVGRTGSGKSSIIQSLFRLAEIKGSIYLDGVNIGDVGLEELRSNVAIIPQEPVLFCGTVRFNLDPYNKYSDDLLWSVLDDMKLRKVITSLDLPLEDGITNLSNGQKQLMCLARAMIRGNKLIVMDEATSNMDPVTDGLVQSIIKRKFADCSMIIIAHRLLSVINCDRILVLDEGCLKEFDRPAQLLKNPHGYFTHLAKSLGSKSFENLVEAAAAINA